jgi:flagellar hook-associated protein FlgK
MRSNAMVSVLVSVSSGLVSQLYRTETSVAQLHCIVDAQIDSDTVASIR